MTSPRLRPGPEPGDRTVPADPPEPHLVVDESGVTLPRTQRTAVDVCLDGRRVWSAAPAEGTEATPGTVRLRWPAPLRPFLDGTARVTLRDHLTQEVLLDQEVRFGDSPARVAVTDEDGRPLAVDHVGHLGRTFTGSDDALRASLLDGVRDVLAVLREDDGVEAFVAFGALLGAVREGRLIGHDSDLDLSYLSRYAHPMDVQRESFALERRLRRRGYATLRMSGADFKVAVPLADGTTQDVDVFGGFRCEDRLYVLPRLRVQVPASALVPTSVVTLEDRSFPAPADPGRFLAAAYGPHWRTPDPTWRPRPERPARRRFDGWMRGVANRRGRWQEVLGESAADDGAAGAGRGGTRGPSALARRVAETEPAPLHVVEVGCGLGTDAVFLAQAGHRVTALDYAESALASAREAAREAGVDVTFARLNLYELRQVLAGGARLAREPGTRVVYARHVAEALDPNGRWALWRLARMLLRGGGRLHLEFRTARPPEEEDVHPGLLVAPLTVAQVTRELAEHDATVEATEEDATVSPPVARLTARW